VIRDKPVTDSTRKSIGGDASLTESGWRVRITTGFWSLADQGAVSLGNFATTLLLGRKLAPADFGVYVVVFGVMVFLNNVQGSLINYPLSVHGAADDWDNLRRLTGLSLLLTAVLLAPMSIGIAGAAWAMNFLALAPWIIAALIFWQFQETLRRALMSQMRHRDAIWGDGISYLGQAVLIGILIHLGKLTLPNALAAIALMSLLGAAVQWLQVRPRSASPSEAKDRAVACWKLGRWTALSNLANVINIQVVLWTLAAVHGRAEAARLAALGLILGVTHPALFSVGNLIIPVASRAMHNGGADSAKRVALNYGLLGGLLVVPFYLLVAFEPHFALRCFYGTASPYLNLQLPLRLFAAAYVMSYIAAVQTALLNGMARSRSALAIQLTMVGGTLAVTLPMAVVGGVVWSLGGGCVSTFAGVATGWVLLGSPKQNRQPKLFVRDDTAAISAAA
jgi:O-antigen/teichoic acid export membrane protein